MEKEMENVFETKVKEKKQKLKDSEHELTQKHKNVSCSTVFSSAVQGHLKMSIFREKKM